ncbi:MAG TPA: hemerythrin domain-containing protein [Ramlibacter sp.]
MKRATELMPLSREHHEALVLARRACEPQRADPAALREQVLRRWGEQFEPHFAAEEQVLLPALDAAGALAEAGAAREDHAHLRALVQGLREGTPGCLGAWGEAMRAHVQWEERHLFPLAEQLLDLAHIGRALHDETHPTA